MGTELFRSRRNHATQSGDTLPNGCDLDEERPAKREEEIKRLMEIVEDMELFHTNGNPDLTYARVKSDREVFRIDSRKFRRKLGKLYMKSFRYPPTQSSVKVVTEAAAATAQFEGSAEAVAVRVAEFEGIVYIDLCNERQEVVKVTPGRWEIVTQCPVTFVRHPGMLSLPVPERGGTLNDFWDHLNVQASDRVLIAGWMVQALHPAGPFPILWITGEQGGAKTTLCLFIRTLIDPNAAPVRAAPRSEREMLITASNSWIQASDNISGTRNYMSDAMCRLATGAGFSARKLFTDAEEHMIYVRRPQVVNGIDDQMLNSDLLDRTLFVTLQAIPKEKRKTEAEVHRQFKANAPRLVGALLEALCQGLKDLPNIALPDLPRMADFAKLAAAAETHMGFPKGAFAKSLAENKLVSDKLVIENSLIGAAIKRFIDETGKFEGSAKKLLDNLERRDDRSAHRPAEWPRLPRQISVVLRRIAPNLRGVGISVKFPPRSSAERTLVLEKSTGVAAPTR